MGCGTRQNRDRNASENIQHLAVGVGHIHDYKRTEKNSQTGLPANPVESSTHTVAFQQLSSF